MTNPEPTAQRLDEQAVAPNAAEPVTDERPAEPETAPATSTKPRAWSMPKSPVTREHADEMGRAAVKAATGIARSVADVARHGARAVTQVWRVLEAVPPALKIFVVAGLLMLFGVVGAIAIDNSLGLICAVVVVPVCSATLGVLGHRWYSGLGAESTRRTDTQPAQPPTSDMQRSVQYVDKKLALALTSFGTEHHQQAVIALFQAKTAVELTLGTEQDTASYSDLPLRAGDYNLRPRIRAGTGTTSTLRESNSLAAS